MDNSAAATPVSQPPLTTQLLQSQSMESFTTNLRTLSDSLSGFQHCFHDLQRHIDSIRTSINSILIPPQTNYTTFLPTPSPPPPVATLAPPPEPEPEPEPEPSWESDPSEDLEEEEGGGGGGEEDEVEKKEVVEAEDVEEAENSEGEGEGEGEGVKSPRSELKLSRSELEILCETMDNRGLLKYMITHVSNFRELREEVPKALRLSPSPATLVLECIGKFYYKNGKRYIRGSPSIQARKAKVLLLEYFLLMIGMYDKGVEIENWVKEEAEQAALAWLKRMNFEGGVLKAQEIDVRGLLLLIGCFGIPDKFTNADIRDLLQVSNLKWVSNALRRSNVLMAKFPEIIEEMVANNAVVKAVHIAYSFGMEDQLNPRTLLTTFLRVSKKSYEKIIGSQHGAHLGNIGFKRKYLHDLKSVIKCLRYHELDPSKLLSGWQINTRIMSLEKEIAEFNKHIVNQKIAQKNAGLHKRKNDETVWLRNKEVKHSHFSNPWLRQHQRVVNHVVGNNTLFEGGGTAGHNYGYFVPPLVLHGPVEGSIHENVVCSPAGPVGGVAIGGPGTGISASAGSIHADMDVVPQGGSYAGGQGGSRVDRTSGQIGSHDGQLYGYPYRPATHLEGPNTIASDTYRPAPFTESSKGLTNTIPGDSSRPPPYLEVSPGLPNTIAGDTYRPAPFTGSSKGLPNTIPGDSSRPPPNLEVSPGLPNTITSNAYRPAPYMESSKGLPNTTPGDANRPQPYLEGSTGLPNTIPPPHQFANTVPATELNQSSGSQAVDAHPSFSLYRKR